jgi:hypothetical protein
MMHYDEALSYTIAKFNTGDGYNEIAHTIADYAQRAETAEAEANAFAAENDAIHRAINEMCGTDTSTIEAVKSVIDRSDELDAEVKRLRAALKNMTIALRANVARIPMKHIAEMDLAEQAEQQAMSALNDYNAETPLGQALDGLGGEVDG